MLYKLLKPPVTATGISLITEKEFGRELTVPGPGDFDICRRIEELILPRFFELERCLVTDYFRVCCCVGAPAEGVADALTDVLPV